MESGPSVFLRSISMLGYMVIKRSQYKKVVQMMFQVHAKYLKERRIANRNYCKLLNQIEELKKRI